MLETSASWCLVCHVSQEDTEVTALLLLLLVRDNISNWPSAEGHDISFSWQAAGQWMQQQPVWGSSVIWSCCLFVAVLFLSVYEAEWSLFFMCGKRKDDKIQQVSRWREHFSLVIKKEHSEVIWTFFSVLNFLFSPMKKTEGTSVKDRWSCNRSCVFSSSVINTGEKKSLESDLETGSLAEHSALKASVVMLTKSCVTDSSAGLLHTCPEGGAYSGLLCEASGPLSCQHGVLQRSRPGPAPSSASRHHGEV